MKKFIALLSLCHSSFALAQENNTPELVPFNGLVTDAAGSPIKNVRVYVHNPIKYATSDKQGRFGLTNVNPDDTLHVRYKRKSYDIPVDGRKSVKIKLGDFLQVDVSEDLDLVDYGYGYVRRRETIAVSDGVTGEELAATGQSVLLLALQGKVPGLTVEENSGTYTAVIRGRSSLNSDCTPLYVLDGAVVDNLDDVNIYTVDYVEVLKEASIYGSRGSSGVIVVHTKRR